jgi:hypothetical protein
MLSVLRFSASLLLQSRPVAPFRYKNFSGSAYKLASFSSASASVSAAPEMSGRLTGLQFDNRNVERLPVDASFAKGSRQVPNAIFSLVDPTPVKKPLLLCRSQAALDLLGVSAEESDEQIAKFLGGCEKIPGMVVGTVVTDTVATVAALCYARSPHSPHSHTHIHTYTHTGSRPAAHVYCGHQFGNFAGQLGDGATMYLGEVVNQVCYMSYVVCRMSFYPNLLLFFFVIVF